MRRLGGILLVTILGCSTSSAIGPVDLGLDSGATDAAYDGSQDAAADARMDRDVAIDAASDATVDAASDATVDAASDVAVDAASDATSGDGGSDAGAYAGVACGFSGLVCDVDVGCCSAGETCIGATCSGSLFLCDGPEDCPGQSCCLEFGNVGPPATGSRCMASCVTGLVRYPACHSAADCDVGESCCDSLGGPASLGGPYQICLGGGCPQ